MGVVRLECDYMQGTIRQNRRNTMQRVATITTSCALLVFACDWSDTALAVPQHDAWREAVAQTRRMADDDAPRAFAEAQRLQASMSADATPDDQVAILNLLARAELHMSLNDRAEADARQALKIATEHKNRIGQAEADLNLAIVLVYVGKIDELVTVTTHALSVLDGVDNPELLGEALLRTAMMYRRIGLTDESVTMTMQAEEIAKRSHSPLVLAYAEHGLAISYLQNGRSVEAGEHYAKMFEQAKRVPAKWLEAEAVIGLSEIEGGNGDARHAEERARAGLALYREFGSPFGISFAQFHLAENLRKQGRYTEAHSLLDEVIAVYGKYSNRIALWYALNTRSGLHLSLGDKRSAWADSERAYALAKDIGFPAYISESARHMAALYAARGDTGKAYALQLEAGEMADKLVRERNSAHMLQLVQRYQTESKQREINELTSLNRLQESELKQHALETRWLMTVIVGFLVIFGGAAFFVRRLHRSQNKVRVLNASLERRVQERTAEMRLQARYMRTLIDALPLPVWLKDPNGRYMAINQVAAKAFGHTVEEMTGKHDTDFLPQEISKSSRTGDVDVMLTRKPKVTEAKFIGSSGLLWHEIYKAPVQDEDASVLGIVGFARDISAQKAVDAARESALAEARNLAQSRSDFMAQMSHELRTPLNGILGYTQNMLRDASLSEQQTERLRIILQSGDHLLGLINDILDQARIDAGKLELDIDDIALSTFFHRIVDIMRARAEQKNFTFVFEHAPNLPVVIRGDAQRLRQVLLNLLSNAIKFTDSGTVCFRVNFLTPSRLCVAVQDTGVGISADQLEKIFQPFEQVGERSRRATGSGLGLAISRSLVRLMGGDIKVESRPGAGSTFSFEIDVSVVQSQGAEIMPAPVTIAAEPKETAALIAPPEHELEILHALARRGNMRKVVQHAEHLDSLGKVYRPFADQLRRLAKGYQSQAILSLVEQCRERQDEA